MHALSLWLAVAPAAAACAWLAVAAAETAAAEAASCWNARGLLASCAKAFGLAAIAAIACGFEASAANAGSAASFRKFGSFTMTWNASVCISSGTDVSPSVTSPSPTCDA